MRGYRVVICDDEQLEREFYATFCRKLGEKYDIDLGIKMYESGEALLFDFDNPKFASVVDVLFLDIHMSGINGIEVADELRQKGYKGVIVFITVSKEHYEHAFDVRAFNYITKGERVPERFEQVFVKAVEEAKEIRKELILLSGGGEYRQVRIEDIYFFQIVKKIITVFYNDQSFEFCSTLEYIENQLFDRGFQRIHRGYLVSLYQIKGISYEEVTLTNGERLPVGRKYYPALKKALTELKL